MSPRTAKKPKGATSAVVAPTATAEYDTGVEIRYWERDKDKGVKRHYDIRKWFDPEKAKLDIPGPNWRTVPSVSSVKDILDAPPTWWGMQVGVEGVVQLYNTGLVFPVEVQTINGSHRVLGLRDSIGQIVTAGMENVVDELKRLRLTTNDKKDEGSKRGQSVHDAFKRFCDHGEIPIVMDYPPQEQGYISAMLRFLEHAQPEPIASEVIVASAEHGFAGRYDVRFNITEPRQVVVHHTPVRGPQFETIEPGHVLGDIKTSKYVYMTHAFQLALYEIASRECGIEPTTSRMVIQFEGDGQYRFVRADEWCTLDGALVLLNLYNTIESMKSRKPLGGRH